jgi:hypothetical protein
MALLVPAIIGSANELSASPVTASATANSHQPATRAARQPGAVLPDGMGVGVDVAADSQGAASSGVAGAAFDARRASDRSRGGPDCGSGAVWRDVVDRDAAGVAPTGSANAEVPQPVFTVNRNWPSWVIFDNYLGGLSQCASGACG